MATVDQAPDDDPIPLLLVTANVGSIFEDPDRLLHIWIDAFVAKVAAQRPQFVALHLQEVGGKTYDKSMEFVQQFIRILCEAPDMQRFTRIRVYLDEDYSSAEHFTALGNLYFVDDRLSDARIWNFLTHEWEPDVAGKSVHTGNIEAVPTKEKAKFPQHFFPECKWSRKGFLRTRWSLNGTVVDLVNIHLFHDASNLAACEEFPSVYCRSRRRALVHTMERFHRDRLNGVAPYFVFGDFNFRTDQAGVVRRLAETLSVHRLTKLDRQDASRVQYRDEGSGKCVLSIGKKEFAHLEHQTTFKEEWFRQFNRELEPLVDVLYEYPITFAPSYPYEEEPSLPHHYMKTRCPAWCDRILLSTDARSLVVPPARTDSDDDPAPEYDVIGDAVCMGDHKPIYLTVRLATQKDLSVRSIKYRIPSQLQSIIDRVLVPPYDSAQAERRPSAVVVENDIDKKIVTPPWSQSRYVQIPRRPAQSTRNVADESASGAADAANSDASGAFSYNCSAGIVCRETAV